MENKVSCNDDHDLRPAHQLNGGQMKGLGRRLDDVRSLAAAAAANSSGRKRRSNKGGGFKNLKVVYISTPMKVRTSASKFRQIVQELTGKYSDVARIMESSTTTGGDGSELQDMYWTTLDDDHHSYQHHHEQKETSNADYYDCNNINNNNTQIQNKNGNLHHVVRGGTAPPVPLGEHSPASSSATPTSGAGAESLMFESFDLDDLQAVCTTAGSSSGARLDDDHFLMADEGSLLGSFNYLEFPGNGGGGSLF